MTSPNDAASGKFGTAVSGLFDVNNDGASDIVVGTDETAGASASGRVYVFDGATGSLLLTIASPNPDTSGRFGRSVSGVPDVNGDGRGDVVVGAFQENPGASPSNSGRAYVFSGADGSLLRTLASPNEVANGNFGRAVAGVPDVNGDLFGDVIVGSDEAGGPSGSGRVYVFSGLTGGLIHTIVSPNAEGNGRFGRAVAGSPDITGDNRGEIIVGAFNEDPGTSPSNAGRAYIFSGASAGLLQTLASPNEESGGNFGTSVSGIPDVNGDAAPDVVVGAPVEDGGATDSGRAYIFSGANGAHLRTLASPNAQATGNFGVSVGGMPDTNGDGLGEAIVGADLEDAGNADSGRAYIFSGADGAAVASLTSPNDQASGGFGAAVAGLSDINADGRGDVIIGALNETAANTNSGRAYVYKVIYLPTRLFVDASAAAAGDGVTWSFAFRFLKDALSAANNYGSVTEIWVANGTYNPDQSESSPSGSGNRSESFVVPFGTAVYGGFAGGETLLSQRNPAVNVGVLSGDLNGDDGPSFVNRSDNSLNVVQLPGSTILDGFTVSGGNADSGPTEGGGVQITGSGAALRQCIITDCQAVAGGGVYASAAAQISDCRIEGNFASSSGAGAFFDAALSDVVRCVFLQNDSNGSGGGASISSTTVDFVNCRFLGNSSASHGGGIFVFASSTADVAGAEFSGNSAAGEGGGIMFDAGNGTLLDCSFSGNTATGGSLGGAVRASGGNVAIRNGIAWGNSTPQFSVSGGTFVVTFSDVEGGFAGTGNIDADPLFSDADGADNTVGTEDDDLTLQQNSPAIDAGDNTVVPLDTFDLDGDSNTAEPLPIDLAGDPRFHDDTGVPDTGNGTAPIVDMGAYEFQGTSIPPPPGTGDFPWDGQTEISTTDNSPEGVVHADLDSDGDIDVIVAAHGSVNRVVWFENLGGEPLNFTRRVIDASLSFAVHVAVADLNRDGFLDVIAAGSVADEVRWYENDGGAPPTFTQRVVASGVDGPRSVAVGDLDQDGDPDVVVAAQDADTTFWFENDGASLPSFTTRTVSTNEDGPVFAGVADLNCDGLPDIFTASVGDNTIAWHRNAGGAPPTFVSSNIDTNAVDPFRVISADLNRDGAPDLISTSNSDLEINWHRSNGANPPVFTTLTILASQPGESTFGVAAGDIDFDGDTDLLVAHPAADEVYWYENSGAANPTFTQRLVTDQSSQPMDVALADLDGDGDSEAVVTGQVDNSVAYSENLLIHSTAMYSSPDAAIAYMDGPTAMVTGDFDCDGDQDLAVCSFFDDTVAWLENAGDGGNWTKRVIVNSGSGSNRADGPSVLVATDLELDGDLDLVSASFLDGRIQAYLNSGAATPVFSPHLLATVSGLSALAFGDVSRDGRPDMVYGNTIGVSARLSVAGSDPPQFGIAQSVCTTGLARNISIGDIDFSGAPDVIVADKTGGVVIWNSNDSGVGTSWTDRTVESGLDGPIWTALGDLDRNGTTDIVSALSLGAEVHWHENLGAPLPNIAFTPQTIGFGQDGASGAAIGDLDNDGDPDVVSTARIDDAIVVFESDGGDDPNWQDFEIDTFADGASAAVCADFNGDGFLDFAACSFGDDKIRVYLNEGVQAGISSASTAPAQIGDGASDDVLRTDVGHFGLSGDSDVHFASLDLLFTDQSSTPLTTLQANDLLDEIEIVVDDGNGTYNPGVDTPVASVNVFALAGGVQTVPIPSGAGSLIAVGNPPRRFFVVLTMDANASNGSVLMFRVSAQYSSGTLLDAQFSEPLRFKQPSGDQSTTLIEVPPVVGANTCAADLDADGSVGSGDLNLMLSSWGLMVMAGTGADISGDGIIGSPDLNMLLTEWGMLCGEP